MMDKVDIINYLFRSFNKDPYQHKDQVKHFLIECKEFDAELVDRAVKEVIVEETYLPKAWIIVNKCKTQLKSVRLETEECFLCNGMGLIFSVFCIKHDGSRLEIVSDSHEVKMDAHYTTNIVGYCGCLNGKVYSQSKKKAEPWSFIKEAAINNGWDCVYQTDLVAKQYNRIINGKEKIEKNPQIEKLVDKIVNRFGA